MRCLVGEDDRGIFGRGAEYLAPLE